MQHFYTKIYRYRQAFVGVKAFRNSITSDTCILNLQEAIHLQNPLIPLSFWCKWNKMLMFDILKLHKRHSFSRSFQPRSGIIWIQLIQNILWDGLSTTGSTIDNPRPSHTQSCIELVTFNLLGSSMESPLHARQAVVSILNWDIKMKCVQINPLSYVGQQFVSTGLFSYSL